MDHRYLSAFTQPCTQTNDTEMLMVERDIVNTAWRPATVPQKCFDRGVRFVEFLFAPVEFPQLPLTRETSRAVVFRETREHEIEVYTPDNAPWDLMQIFEPIYYERCDQCNRMVREEGVAVVNIVFPAGPAADKAGVVRTCKECNNNNNKK